MQTRTFFLPLVHTTHRQASRTKRENAKKKQKRKAMALRKQGTVKDAEVHRENVNVEIDQSEHENQLLFHHFQQQQNSNLWRTQH